MPTMSQAIMLCAFFSFASEGMDPPGHLCRHAITIENHSALPSTRWLLRGIISRLGLIRARGYQISGCGFIYLHKNKLFLFISFAT